MTLLITLGDRSVLHQSSDYRISDNGRALDTANGTKQLFVNALGWTAMVAFTGVASSDFDSYKTVRWIDEVISAMTLGEDPASFARRLCEHGSSELGKVRRYDRRLSIVVAVGSLGGCKLFLISNFEEPRHSPQAVPRENLEPFELDLSRPLLLLNGATSAVPRHEKKMLERAFAREKDPAAIRKKIAAINKLAASRSRFKNLISEGCWVSSLSANGRSSSENHGMVPGVPEFNYTPYLRNRLLPAGGQQPTLKFVTSTQGMGPSQVVGEPFEVPYSTPMTIWEAPSGLPRVVLGGVTGTVKLRKNAWVKVLLNTVTLEIATDSEFEDIDHQALENIPTIFGAMANRWHYVFDLSLGGTIAVLSVRQSSVALRGGGIVANEQIVMKAPSDETDVEAAFTDNMGNTWICDGFDKGCGLFVTATRDSPKAVGEIHAMMFLCDCP